MGNPFSYFPIFLWSVGNHIFTLLSGCVVTVLIGIIDKRFLKRPISLKLEIGILAAFLFFACFQAWRDEYQQLTIAQAELDKKPIAQVPIQVNIPPIKTPPAVVIERQVNGAQPRRLSESKRLELADSLKQGNGKRVSVFVPNVSSAHDRQEREDYANDLRLAFEEAGWKVILNKGPAPSEDLSGIVLMYYVGPGDAKPDFEPIKKALDSTQISYSMSGHGFIDLYTGGVSTADPVIYIGEK